MSSSIQPPDLNHSYCISADWLELLCLVRDMGSSTDSDITAPHDILDDHAAIMDYDSILDDEENLDITDSPRDRALDALYDEIDRRTRELGDAYPFTARTSLDAFAYSEPAKRRTNQLSLAAMCIAHVC